MPYKPVDPKRLESLARSWSLTALKTLGNIMTNTTSRDADRIRAAEVILEHGGGLVAASDMGGRRLSRLALEVVHLAPMSREEFADREAEPLQVEWHEVKNGNGQMHEHDRS
jgi:hypothetical protein